nr:MBOAT family O-acyltransferase [Alteromonas sp. Cnat3-28]
MLFPTFSFLFVFLPLTFVIFFWLTIKRGWVSQVAVLLTASLVFYLLPNWEHAYIIVSSVLVNFFIARWLLRLPQGTGRWLLTVGVTFNLGVIGYYKYAFFGTQVLNGLLDTQLSFSQHVLPVGISFYTFQQIAFLVDTFRYRNTAYRLKDYALFVTFFPQLIAGPIVHHSQVMPQIEAIHKKPFNWSLFNIGLVWLVVGVFKKIILADNFAKIANPVFNHADKGFALSLADSWSGSLGYTLQLYFDFSAYSEMAIGLAFMFGVKLPLNFFSPYKAPSIVEFWRRWHITLSTFLRDYLYIALGGNRKGKLLKYVNLFITMLLGGLWHGAGWGFIIWGALHGLYLIINHFFRFLGVTRAMPKAVSVAITFFAVVCAWVFFRAVSIEGAFNVLSGMFALSGTEPNKFAQLYHWVFIAIGLFVVFALPNVSQLLNYQGPETADEQISARWSAIQVSRISALLIGLSIGLAIMFMPEPTVFIYFNF